MGKHVITRICKGQPELAVKLVQPGCQGGQLVGYEGIRLVITAPECACRLKSELRFTGCWPGYTTPYSDSNRIHDVPALVYPAFDINAKGETVFRFDHLLWERPAGRYIGTIELNDGTKLATLDIDLCNIPVFIDSVSVTHESCVSEDI